MYDIHVANIPPQVTQKELKDIFQSYKSLVDVRIKKQDEKAPVAYAFVVFESKEEAIKAVQELTDFPCHGAPLRMRLSYETLELIKETEAKEKELKEAADKINIPVIRNLKTNMQLFRQENKWFTKEIEEDMWSKARSASEIPIPAFGVEIDNKLITPDELLDFMKYE